MLHPRPSGAAPTSWTGTPPPLGWMVPGWVVVVVVVVVGPPAASTIPGTRDRHNTLENKRRMATELTSRLVRSREGAAPRAHHRVAGRREFPTRRAGSGRPTAPARGAPRAGR